MAARRPTRQIVAHCMDIYRFGSGQSVRALTKKVMKVHQGNPENKAFMIHRVLGGEWVALTGLN